MVTPNQGLERPCANTAGNAQSTNDHDKREFLSFRIAEEEYCLDILKVQEIRGYETVTPLAGTPPHVKGVMNLRGSIVPVFDLRIKLGLDTPRYDDSTIVIILNLDRGLVGGVVDSVSDVIALTANDVKPAPELGTGIDIRFIEGIASYDERMLIMVNIDRFINEQDLKAIPEERLAA